MTKKIAIINNKGGVGKTTTGLALASEVSLLNRKVLYVDLDPQGNSSRSLGLYENTEKKVSDVFNLRGTNLTKENVMECVYQTKYENIWMIPNNEEFSLTMDSIFVDTGRSQQYVLKKAMQLIEEEFDYIFIDTNPFFNLITVNTLAYVDEVITPIATDGYSLMGLTKLLEKIEEIKNEFNPALKMTGAFFTRVKDKTNLYKEMNELYQEGLSSIFISTYIRENNKFIESTTAFEPITYYAPNSSAALDYRILLKHLNILDPESSENLEKKFRKRIADLKQKNKEDEKKIAALKKEPESDTKIKRIRSRIEERNHEIERITQ